MQQLARGSISDEFSNALGFQKLPVGMQSILSVWAELLEIFDIMAHKIDKIRSDIIVICAIGDPFGGKPVFPSDSPRNEMSTLHTKIILLSQKVEVMSKKRTGGMSCGRHFNSKHRPVSSK